MCFGLVKNVMVKFFIFVRNLDVLGVLYFILFFLLWSYLIFDNILLFSSENLIFCAGSLRSGALAKII